MRDRSEAPSGRPPAPQRQSSRDQRQKLEPSGFVEERNGFMALPRLPYAPAAYDAADIGAFKALARGEAQPHQQMRVLEWLMYMTGTYASTYVPGDASASDFAQGKRWAGQQVVTLLNIQMAKPEGQEGEHG